MMRKSILLVWLMTCLSPVFAQQDTVKDTYTAIIQLRPHKDVILLPYDLEGDRLAFIQTVAMPGYSNHQQFVKRAPWCEDEVQPFLPSFEETYIPLPQGLKAIAPKGNMPGKDFTIEGEEALLIEGVRVAPYVSRHYISRGLTSSLSEYQRLLRSDIDMSQTRYPRKEYGYNTGSLAYWQLHGNCRYAFFVVQGLIPFRYESDPYVRENNRLYVWKTIRVTMPVEARTDMPVYTEADREYDASLRKLYSTICMDRYALESMYESFDDYLSRQTSVQTPRQDAEALTVHFDGGYARAFCTLPRGAKGELTVCDMQGRMLESYKLSSTYNNVEVAAQRSGMVLTLYINGRLAASKKSMVTP